MAKKRKKSMGKIYHNKTVIDGITFDSQTEAEYYEYVKNNKKKLNINKIELQPKFLLQEKFLLADNIVYICKGDDDKEFKKIQKRYPKCTTQAIYYIADFKITYNDSSIDVIDIKGIKTTDFKIKEKMFNFKYPMYNGLKCITKYKNEWLTWDELQKRKKEDKKENEQKKKEKEKKEKSNGTKKVSKKKKK